MIKAKIPRIACEFAFRAEILLTQSVNSEIFEFKKKPFTHQRVLKISMFAVQITTGVFCLVADAKLFQQKYE